MTMTSARAGVSNRLAVARLRDDLHVGLIVDECRSRDGRSRDRRPEGSSGAWFTMIGSEGIRAAAAMRTRTVVPTQTTRLIVAPTSPARRADQPETLTGLRPAGLNRRRRPDDTARCRAALEMTSTFAAFVGFATPVSASRAMHTGRFVSADNRSSSSPEVCSLAGMPTRFDQDWM